MIKTKNLIGTVSQIPSNWVYQYYLGCPVLDGQNIMIKSPFNPKDSNPSMSIYLWKGKEYRWQDFSAGKSGGVVDLVMEMGSIGYIEATYKIIQDYNKSILDGNGTPVIEFKERAKYRVIDCPKRAWDMTDDMYWNHYELGETNLSYLEAYPLKSYTLSNGEKQLKIQGFHIYGYFTKEGELYKIYQPMVRDRKFLCMKNWISGLEQLQYKYPTIVLTSSLKDIASLLATLLPLEVVAANSETTILKEAVIDEFKSKYKNVLTLMNSDSAGERAAAKYKELYGLESINLGMEKDPSDSIKKHGSGKVKSALISALSKFVTV